MPYSVCSHPISRPKKLICSTSTFDKETMRNHAMSRSALNEGHGTQLALNDGTQLALNGAYRSFIGGRGDCRQRPAFMWLFRPCEAKLSGIFLLLHIDEKTGRGIPVNSSKYGDGTFDFYDNDITVIIPFRFINEVGNKVGNKTDTKMTPNRKKILS